MILPHGGATFPSLKEYRPLILAAVISCTPLPDYIEAKQSKFDNPVFEYLTHDQTLRLTRAMSDVSKTPPSWHTAPIDLTGAVAIYDPGSILNIHVGFITAPNLVCDERWTSAYFLQQARTP